jgi:hypothetical protein
MHPDDEPNQVVIVEITPRLRKQMKDQGQDWTSETLRDPVRGINGKWVEFTGWLTFDFMHTDGAANTNPDPTPNQDIWRVTCWEIHPVTSFRVLERPPPEAGRLNRGDIARLHTAHTERVREHINRHPAAKQAIADRLAADRAHLAPEENEEADKEHQSWYEKARKHN